MITAFIQGGAANQIFQFAFGLATAKRLNVKLGFNLSNYHTDSLRQYALSLWELDYPLDWYPPQEPIIQEQSLPYNQELVDSIKDGCTLRGYWQSESYIKDIKQELKEILTPKKPLSEYGKQTLQMIKGAGPRSTFLTIRRTDYLNSDYHGVLGINYYLEALNILSRKVDPIVFVFSDDPEWCKKELHLPCPMFVRGNYAQTTKTKLGREDEELFLMRKCHNAILANSSYSWWGAWLGADETGGTIVAPRNWFGPECKEDSRDIVPDRWTKI